MRFLTLLLWVVFFIPSTTFAGPGRTGAQILNLGGGARARALGDAFSAMSGDVYHFAMESKWFGDDAR